ncbi:MAG: polyamine aminopropyltransferase [Chloroflexi bacterium]|nr:polyamine aminopropyltransferase [Chloroflexota bacterium]MCI0797036.1 polyamine aminopropyltransferase [Chloroflexota bacterium]
MDNPPDGNWHYELITPDLLQAENIDRVLYEGQTAYQHVRIHDAACFGRTLVLDDKTQSTEVDEFVYHEALVQPCMIAHPGPRVVFVAGGGEGATIREVLRHRSVEKVVMVDIDREVVEVCKKYLPNHHQGSFDDPRLELIHDDALKYLEETPQRFDVAIIDVPDPLEAGPAYLLFTQEFYRLLQSRLTERGLMVAQSGPTGPAFTEQCFSAVANTVGSVFPAAYLCEAFVPAFGATWGFVVGSLGPNPSAMQRDDVDRRIADRINGELRYYDGITQQGMFSVPKYLRRAVAAEDRIITRANPLFVE